jgi:hypothetical protein
LLPTSEDLPPHSLARTIDRSVVALSFGVIVVSRICRSAGLPLRSTKPRLSSFTTCRAPTRPCEVPPNYASARGVVECVNHRRLLPHLSGLRRDKRPSFHEFDIAVCQRLLWGFSFPPAPNSRNPTTWHCKCS